MNRTYRQKRFFTALFSLSLCWLFIGCDSEEKTSTCASDDDCTRGQICDTQCIAVPCESITDCPGSGRTCAQDLNQCTAKECADELRGVLRECTEGLTCLTEGPFRFSCISSTPESVPCVGFEDCVGQGVGETCCNGQCAMTCDVPIIPLGGMEGGWMGAGTEAGTQAGAQAGTQVTSSADLCTPCSATADCADLGDTARCTPIGEGSFCTRACDETTPCPNGYACPDMIGQCIPSGFDCVACLQTPCEVGGFCDLSTGECTPPQPLCGSCTEDAGCAEGRVCGAIGSRSLCLPACDSGCPEGSSCMGGACAPDSGECDACGGSCDGETPYCVEAEQRCAACGPTAPCGEGFNCDLETFTCVEGLPNGSCLSDVDCTEGRRCFGGACRDCLEDSDCPARNFCDLENFICEYAPCAGVICQRSSMCDSATGRCAPGCATRDDCADPTAMECNTDSGQCYFPDGNCEFGGDAVCPPGSQCVPNPLAAFDPTLPNACTCTVGMIECHPGLMCVDLGALLEGFGLDMLGLEFDATCGTGF